MLAAKFAYHYFKDPGKFASDDAPFQLEVRTLVAFEVGTQTVKHEQNSGEQPLTMSQNAIGAMVHPMSWITDSTVALRTVKWSRKGLMPVAPRIVLAEDLRLGGQEALVI